MGWLCGNKEKTRDEDVNNGQHLVSIIQKTTLLVSMHYRIVQIVYDTYYSYHTDKVKVKVEVNKLLPDMRYNKGGRSIGLTAFINCGIVPLELYEANTAYNCFARSPT